MSDEELKKLAQLIQQMPEMQKNIDGQQHEMSYLTGAEQDAMETVRRDPGLIQSLAEQGKEMQPRYENGVRAFPGMGGEGSGDASSTGVSSSSSSSSSSSGGGRTRGYATGSGASHGGPGSHEGAVQNTPRSGSGSSSSGPAYQGATGRDLYSPSSGGPDRGQFETRPHVIQARNTPEGRAGDWNAHLAGGGDSGGGAGKPPPPKPKFKDMNGKEWNTQAEADASNARIKAAMGEIEGQVLTSDTTHERWLARNKDKHPDLTAEQIETAYNTARTKSLEDASAQLPRMVENMNNYLKDAGAGTTYEEWLTTIPEADKPKNISDATLREMYAKATSKAERNEAFTLTPEEVDEFARSAIQMATADNFEEWWAGKGGAEGTYKTEEEARAVHEKSVVADAEKVTIDDIDAAEVAQVGEVADVTETEIAAIKEVTDEDMDKVFAGGIDAAEALLLKRVSGETTSPAEEQLKRTTENNLRMMLGATAGGDANPAKIRQLKNIWSDMQQDATGRSAELRSQEQMEAESKLVELYKGKSTMKLQQRLANLETEKQTAMKNGDLEAMRKITNQATSLNRVITQANIEKDTNLKNLETAKEKAIAQGKMNVATALANLTKNYNLAQVNAELATTGRSMDDALSIAAYKGQQALQGLEVEVDVESTKADLAVMGFELTRDIAELDAQTQRYVAELTRDWKRESGNKQRQDAIIGLIGTALATYATIKTSDIRAKTNISAAGDDVERFLDALNAYQYEYRDPDAAGSDPGMFTGVMAQDLEKSPMGASFVQDTPQGKVVDYGHGLAAILASQANIHDRLRQLEEV